MLPAPMIKAVLFDLDGTLADTAPDLGHALNLMRRARGLPSLPPAAIRPVASHGARGLLGLGFNLAPQDEGYDTMREEFLTVYEANLCRETRLFAGIAELLTALEARGLPWGIVTNKQERFTLPLLDLLRVRQRAACIISGDTTAKTKPHPEPLLAASRAVGFPPQACVYVGDDRRDMQAGLAAGMRVAVAGWGYLNGNDPENWGAHWTIDRPEQLLRYL